MKANEAPEKIYVHKSQYWGLMANEHNITKNGIEYTRTDAFIERAAKWLEKYADSYTWYNEFEGESGMIEDFIRDFRNAMKL